MNRVLVRVYGAFHPVDRTWREAVAGAGAAAIGQEEPWLFLEQDLLRISWEGLHFPLDEVLTALAALLRPGVEGRLDYLDLEDWTLTRHLPDFSGERPRFHASVRDLNQVLEYSGH